MTATVMIFSAYPPQVWEVVICPVRGIPGKTPRPTLADIKTACDVAYEPIERQIERERVAESHRRALAPPRAARSVEDQARIDQQVAETRRALGMPPEGVAPKGVQPPPLYRGDGKHAQRIAADLAARRQRNL